MPSKHGPRREGASRAEKANYSKVITKIQKHASCLLVFHTKKLEQMELHITQFFIHFNMADRDNIYVQLMYYKYFPFFYQFGQWGSFTSHIFNMYDWILSIFNVCIFTIKYKTVTSRTGKPANFLAAVAPDFFFKRLRLLIFFSQWLWLRLLVFFFRAAPAPSGQKNRLRLLTIG